MEFVAGFAAGLLTLLNPCVLPMLPIVLASALQAGRLGPVALAAGMGVSFVVLGLGVTVAGRGLGIDPDDVAQAGAVVLIGLGMVLLVPAAGERLAAATAGLSARADAGIDRMERGSLAGQAGTGALLGAVWSPCIGPTLGGAIALAAQGESLARAAAIMASFALGVGVVLMALAYGARTALRRRMDMFRALASRSRQVTGGLFVALGLFLLTGLYHRTEVWLLDVLPPWLVDFSVSV
ncbi:MAG: cytochrome c biogenesis protein CcdA [Rhodobacteraceae bacterium]|nr:cytochrome c biogenesis protein CcdA [Paracoccaceae bacterium]